MVRKKTDTYTRILDIAEYLFANQGYAETSTRQISSKAKISIQTLHYHIGNKANLYRLVQERSMIPVTNLINQHVLAMLKEDLNDDRVIQRAIDRIVEDLFDMLNANPSYAPLFFRMWLEKDPELRKVEWEQVVPIINQWGGQVEKIVDSERKKGFDLKLLFLSISWIYWGLFVNSGFISELLGIDKESPEYIARIKQHAKNITLQILSRDNPPPHQAVF